MLVLKRTLSGYAIYNMSEFNGAGIPGVIVHRFPPGTPREVAEADLLRRSIEVRKAYGADARPVGWDLFIRGEWAQRFELRRDAVAAAQTLTTEKGI